jgi:glycerol-3-phosphate acyltransferase PlsY
MELPRLAGAAQAQAQAGPTVKLALGVLLAYLLGAIPTSYLVARRFGHIDLREHGSKNLGATNLYRVMGWRYAVPAGAFDIAKGTIPVVLIAPRLGGSPWLPVALGMAAILGHVFSVFVRFHGGKGVATAAGAVLGLAPLPLAVSAAVWVVVVWTSRYVSLGSMAGAAAFPLATWWLQRGDTPTLIAGVLLALFILFNHRTNIRRLLEGREARFRQPRAAP